MKTVVETYSTAGERQARVVRVVVGLSDWGGGVAEGGRGDSQSG